MAFRSGLGSLPPLELRVRGPTWELDTLLMEEILHHLGPLKRCNFQDLRVCIKHREYEKTQGLRGVPQPPSRPLLLTRLPLSATSASLGAQRGHLRARCPIHAVSCQVPSVHLRSTSFEGVVSRLQLKI